MKSIEHLLAEAFDLPTAGLISVFSIDILAPLQLEFTRSAATGIRVLLFPGTIDLNI